MYRTITLLFFSRTEGFNYVRWAGAVTAAAVVAVRELMGGRDPGLEVQINLCLRSNAIKRGNLGAQSMPTRRRLLLLPRQRARSNPDTLCSGCAGDRRKPSFAPCAACRSRGVDFIETPQPGRRCATWPGYRSAYSGADGPRVHGLIRH